MTRIVLIRHGKTYANENWIYCGWTDLPLSDKGRELIQAKKEAGEYPDMTGMRLITSGMKRAEETFEIIFGKVPHEIMPGLKEMNFGAFEGFTYEQMKDDPVFMNWMDNKETAATPGGEMRPEMRKRVIDSMESIIADGRDAAVVLHGGPITEIMRYYFPETDKSFYDWHPDNGDGWELTFEGSRPVAFSAILPKA